MITIALQAGGRSSRMGQDKGLVPLAGKPMIEHQLEVVAHLGDEILITTNRPDDYAYLGVKLAADEEPGLGALNGLYTALAAARGVHTLVLACDLPFLNRRLLEHLLGLADRADVIVPLREGEYEPLHAVYSRNCLPAVREAIGAGKKRMISFFPQVSLHPVPQEVLHSLDREGLSFFNVNTPDDLMRAEDILARREDDLA